MKIKSMYHGGRVTETKQRERNGVPVGIVAGYIATWDVDRGDWTGVKDRFLPGAFIDSIARHKETGRQVRLKDQHGRTVGGFPIDTVREDSTGLYGVGEINLDVQQGREAFALARQGVLTDFSIGWEPTGEMPISGGIREITKAEIWEGSIVDEPMNPKANILAVKAADNFQDLPLAPRSRLWDMGKAVARVREFTGSDNEPGAKYKNAFIWYDRENADNYNSYKLSIADIVDGKMVAVPRAIFAAAAAVRVARVDFDIPEQDIPGVIKHIEHYYSKLDLESPFGVKAFRVDDIKGLDERTLERLLITGIRLSNRGAKEFISNIKQVGMLRDEQADHRDDVELKQIYNNLMEITKHVRNPVKGHRGRR